MDLLFWGLTFSVIGKILLGITVLIVHSRIVKETKIDFAVIKQMKRERGVALIAIAFLALGYLLEIIHRGYIFF